MLARRLVPLLGAALTVAVLPAVAVAATDAGGTTDVAAEQAVAAATQSAPTVARGLIVQTTSGTSTTAIEKAADAAASGDVEVADADKLTGTIATVGFEQPVDYDDAAAVADQVEKRDDVVWAVPDARRRASVVSPVKPNDPSFAKQYGLWDTRYTNPAGGYATKAPSVWRSTTGDASVVVAVVDTGIRKEHPDLANQLVAGYDMIGADQDENGDPLPESSGYTYYTANDGNGRDADPRDPGDWINANDQYCYGPDGNDFEASSWHGTHVAGIVAAESGNAKGIAGVAPGVKIQPVRVLGKCGGWDSDIMAGITWASGGSVAGVPANATPADVVNVSLGGYASKASERNSLCQAYGSLFSQAKARGSLVVAAAGNELGNANLAVPASCSNVVSVAATSEWGFRAFYSNVGSTVDIAAAGGDYVVADHGILSTIATGIRGATGMAYTEYMGTSMAAPAVSGAAALLFSLGLDTPAKVEAALKASVSPFRSSSKYSSVTLSDGTKEYHLNLNCTTSRCGAGLLDLSKLPAPIGTSTVSGDLVVGEYATASSSWTRSTSMTYQWMRDGAAISGATSKTYQVSAADVGHRLSYTVRPSASAFAGIIRTSTASDVVPDGSTVTTTGLPSSLRYGTAASVDVSASYGGTPAVGTVKLVRGASEVLGTATLDAYGKATFSISGTRWVAVANSLRVAYEGSDDAPRASSPATAVTVYRAVPTLTKITTGSTVRSTSNGVVWARVYVPGVTHPRGTFGVYDGSKRIQTATIAANANGIKKITLPRLARGKHVLTVKFLGTDLVAPKTSARKTVTSR